LIFLRYCVDRYPECGVWIFVDEVPLAFVGIVFDGEVVITVDVVDPVTFFVVNFFPNGCSFDVLRKIVVCSPFDIERFKSFYTTRECRSSSGLLSQCDSSERLDLMLRHGRDVRST